MPEKKSTVSTIKIRDLGNLTNRNSEVQLTT